MLTAVHPAVEDFALAKKVSRSPDASGDPGRCGFQIAAGITGTGSSTRAQLGVRWRNSFNASTAAKIGQAEIAIIIAKSSASITNSKLLSFAK
jgi:hypothetical protein